MKRSGNLAVLERHEQLESQPAAYDGPVCSKCSAPDEGYALCRVCGYYPKLDKFMEIDYEMEGLVEEVVEPGFKMPSWVAAALGFSLLVIAESVGSAMFLPLDSAERMAWSLVHLIGGALLIMAFQFRGTFYAIMDDTSVTAVDCIVWPPRAWEAIAVRLPGSSRQFIMATVGVFAVLMSLLVIRSVPYSSPFAIDWVSQPKSKSVLAQVASQVKAKGGDSKMTMEEALNSFAEETGVKDLAAEEAARAQAEMLADLDKQIPEDELEGKESVVHTARCIVVGYFASDASPNEVSRIVLATASRFNNSRNKFEILGSVSVQGTPEAISLMKKLRGSETKEPLVDSQLAAVWVKPSARCEIDFNEHGENRQPVNLKLKRML